MDPPFYYWINPINPPDTDGDFDNLCRLCGIKTLEQCRFNLFDSNGVMLDLRNKIISVLQLNISENDGLPKVVCMKCSQNLVNFHRFKTNCEKTAHALLNMACSQSQKNVADLQYHFLANNNAPSTSNESQLEDLLVVKKEVLEPEQILVTNDSEEQYLTPRTIAEEELYTSKPLRSNISENTLTTSSDPVMPRKKTNNKAINTKKITTAKTPKTLKGLEKIKRTKHFDKVKTIENSMSKSTVDNVNHTVVKSKGKITDFMKVKCDFCSKIYNSRASVKVHIMGVHLLNKKCFRRVKCKYCKKYLKGTGALSAHIRRLHTKEFKCICSYCGQGFLSTSVMEYHIRLKHTKERPFQCNHCELNFTAKHLLNSHIFNRHNEDNVKESCEICHKVFANIKTLKIHKKIHDIPIEMRKKFKCSVCGIGHLNSYLLNNHLKSHTGERPFKCESCDKCYADKPGLRVHMLTHTGERKHICEICGSAFALPGTLKIHRLTVHEGLKMYKCNDCDKSYTQNKNLNIHLRNTGHTKAKRVNS